MYRHDYGHNYLSQLSSTFEQKSIGKIFHINKPERHEPQASQAKNAWCNRQLVYVENCKRKSPIVKKMCKKYVAYLSLIPF